MIPERAFAGLLQLDERWEVTAAEFETEPKERFVVAVRETPKLWPSLIRPVETCKGDRIVCHDHAEARSWRHLDAFGKPTEILCAPPRAKCRQCGKVWTVPVPWEGKGKHFTKDFEAFALTLMREMPVRRAGRGNGVRSIRLTFEREACRTKLRIPCAAAASRTPGPPPRSPLEPKIGNRVKFTTRYHGPELSIRSAFGPPNDLSNGQI